MAMPQKQTQGSIVSPTCSTRIPLRELFLGYTCAVNSGVTLRGVRAVRMAAELLVHETCQVRDHAFPGRRPGLVDVAE